MREITAADQREHRSGFYLGRYGGILKVNGRGARLMVDVTRMLPALFVLQIDHSARQFRFQPRLPPGVEGGIDL